MQKALKFLTSGEVLPKNREEAIRKTREFLRGLKVEYDGKFITPRLGGADAIHEALCKVPVSDDIEGEITLNMISTALRAHAEETGSRASWNRLIAAVCGFQLNQKSKLFKIQSEIRAYSENRDDDRNDKLVDLFRRDKRVANYDTRLLGAFVVYRQVTDTSNTEKAIMVIEPVAASTGMKFRFIRCDDKRRYFMAEGRVMCLDRTYMLVGGIYNPNGFQAEGAALISLSRAQDETGTGINDEKIFAIPGLHSICADFLDPCSTKMMMIRLGENEEKVILNIGQVPGADGVRSMVDYFCDEEILTTLSFDDAVDEIMDRTENKLSQQTVIAAIGNETTQEDTLHPITILT
jgi:hypothetical protein